MKIKGDIYVYLTQILSLRVLSVSGAAENKQAKERDRFTGTDWSLNLDG